MGPFTPTEELPPSAIEALERTERGRRTGKRYKLKENGAPKIWDSTQDRLPVWKGWTP